MGNEENKTLYDIYRGILCNNQSFQLGKQAQVEYRFDCPEYTELKEKYHLNEIAGNGTELEHSVRLLKYLAPKLTHSAWYDNSVPCNGLALLEYSLEQPEHGINCLNKSKILEECCLALGIYARRVRMLPYSPFDSDCHVVTEIFDRTLGKWCMLDPTTNGYLVDETGSVLSLLEARERMAQAGFVTFCRADETVQDLHEVAQKEMEWSAYFAKNLFRLQIDAVSQFGETGKWLDVIPEHFSVRQWSKAKAEYRITMAPEYAKTENGFEIEKMLPLFQKAVKEAENRLLGVETNITNWQRRQNANNNFSATVPYDMEQQKKEMKEFLDDLTTRDQRMMFAVITMVITADSKEQLENDTEALLTTARKHLCQFATLRFQQVDGLNTVMPFGTRKIDAFRTLTTESLSVFIPFRVQDIFHENGIYYGQNVISKNMIIADRKQLLNGNSFILGVSGGGKSFAAKGEIINQVLSSDADIIIIDPEREYSQLVNAMGGEVINISATSDNHINAMDMNKDYGDGANPVILKSEFIMSLCEQLIGGTNLGAKQKSIIDRCTASVYRSYQQNDYQGHIPTLQDFRAELLQQDEPEAKELALAIELFTHGSLNTFAKQTNVDTNNRLICYDILDLGKQLMPIGMLVVLDSILNRITQNRAKGKNTFIFIDEIYLLFQHEYSANFLFTLWKRVRKYGAYASGITQNVDDLLQSHTARTMLANSEFIIMLNQASTDRLELAKLLNISDLQMSYITNVEAGHGLIKVGSSLVPFANKFPKNTKLYKLMTTKPGEA